MATTSVPVNNPGHTGILGLMEEGLSAPRETAVPGTGREAGEPLRRSVNPDLALVRSGLWMWLGFVGASVLACGVHFTFEGASPLALALLAIPAGGALAAFAWRRAYRVLDPVPAAPTAPEPAATVVVEGARAAAPTIAASHPRTALAAR